MLIVTNPHLQAEHIERLVLITESMSYYHGSPGWAYLETLVNSQKTFPAELLTELALRTKVIPVLCAIRNHPNSPRETKVITVLKLGLR